MQEESTFGVKPIRAFTLHFVDGVLAGCVMPFQGVMAPPVVMGALSKEVNELTMFMDDEALALPSHKSDAAYNLRVEYDTDVLYSIEPLPICTVAGRVDMDDDYQISDEVLRDLAERLEDAAAAYKNEVLPELPEGWVWDTFRINSERLEESNEARFTYLLRPELAGW